MSISVNCTIAVKLVAAIKADCRVTFEKSKRKWNLIRAIGWRMLWALPLIFLQSSIGYGQDQATSTVTEAATEAATMFSGVVNDAQQEPAAGLTMDFWLGEQKIGSTVSDASGAFEVNLQIDESAGESLVQVSSEKGHGQFSLSADNPKLALQLSEPNNKSGAPTWVVTFFATILPIVVFAIVFMAIRNRRTGKVID